ncbi:MAG: glycosyltransferase family 1 protein [Hyphomicrobiales bacterium]|nr:glycosyltransferase family 1 protein [Hyphomicrobiales bacterium]
MRILIATDAWRPQVNGVVRTYEKVAVEIEEMGHDLSFLTHEGFRTVPLPSYPEIRLAFIQPRHVRRRVEQFRPDHVHVATEGPIGLAARRWCQLNRHSFTTSYHTRFPEYVSARLPIPVSWGYAFERWFHNSASGVMVATQSLMDDLTRHGIRRLMPWSRGVDTAMFHPRGARLFGHEPVFLYVGRVSVEKNIEAFLRLDLPGKKVVVGGGPQLQALKSAYPDAVFTGPKFGDELAQAYSSADVFVFPSKTDTYGIVLLEAMACGVPVAAFPVMGPKDVVRHGETGVLDDDLRAACLAALDLDGARALDYAKRHNWRNSADEFLDNVVKAHADEPNFIRLRLRTRRRKPAPQIESRSAD